MNKSLIFNEILDENIMYCCNYTTYELDWVNCYTERVFGKIKPGQKCFEYFKCGKTPCSDCKNKVLAENPEKYMNESYLWKKSIPEELAKYYVEDRIVASDSNKKISLLYSYDGYIKMASSSQIKKTYNVLLNKVLKIDLEDSNESKMIHLINAIQELFACDRTVIVEKNLEGIKFVESKKNDILPFELDPVINEKVEKLVDKLTYGKKKKYYYFETKKLEDLDPKLEEIIINKGLNNAVFMKWTSEYSDFNLIVENVGVDYFDEELLLIIYNFCDFVLSVFSYNDRLYHLSNEDALTNLFNRNYYNNYLSELERKNLTSIGVFFCDLDNLKEINDTYGHSIGDRMLKKIASVLKRIFPNDKICRIGGDEFIVIIIDITKKKFTELLNRLYLDLMNENINCSIGSSYRARPTDVIQIIEDAENNMYYYKKKHHKMRDLSKDYQDFKSFVHQDIENNRFTSVIQPILDVKTKKIVSAELLIRGIQNDGKYALPQAFIPLFLKNNCIDLVDYYMIEQACIVAKSFKGKNINIPISINVARKTMDKVTFVEDVDKIFKEYDIDKNMVRFEIMEAYSLSVADIIEAVVKLADMGYKIELDGFATDFSSVALITMNLFSKIKVGENVIREAMNNSLTAEILKKIIAKAHEMGIILCAKEIERKDQLQFVEELGFDEIQGNVYYSPTTLDVFENSKVQEKHK